MNLSEIFSEAAMSWMVVISPRSSIRRPHQALGNRTPIAVWREGRSGELDTAVDMTLRLDNAHALPTCPQPHQQQQPCAA